MDLFSYKNRILHCEDIPVPSLAEKYGTPLYVYSQGTLLHHLRSLQTAFAAAEPLICYSIKVNGNIHIARLMVENGAGCDVTSAGELFRALKAGCPASRMVFAGVGKTDAELKYGLDTDILFFNVESEGELLALGEVARSLGKVGFLTDWGTHRLDSVVQVMHAPAPLSVTAVGGRYDMNDSAQTPAVLQVTYEFPDFILSYESNQFNAHGIGGQLPMRRYYRAQGADDRPHGKAFYGTSGTILSDRIGFEVYPEAARAGRGRVERRQVAGQDRTDLHTRNFIDCVRSRQRPVADVEIAHRSTILPHLGNIAYRTGRKLRWNAEREEIIDDRQASESLGRQARVAWNLI